MSIVNYQSTLFVGSAKEGKLKCDPDGYYDICIGAFDEYNSGNAFYDFNSAKAHFDHSHELMRRVANGALYGERGHPVPVPGMSKAEWITRILQLDLRNTSHHLRELTLDDSQGITNKNGGRVVQTFARIKPTMDQLGMSLDNPHENTAFSIRSLTEDVFDPIRGCMVKLMKKIVTWDWVVEPGMSTATKHNTPSLESLIDSSFTERDLNEAIIYVRDRFCSMESSDLVNVLSALKSTGKMMPDNTLRLGKLPPSAHWK